MIATSPRFLDAAADDLRRGHVELGTDRLFTGLHRMRHATDPARWREFVDGAAREHPVFALVQRCPMTRHAFEKPRGYAGDAELLDYLYRMRRPVDDGSLGYRIWDHMSADRPAAQAVRKRRHVIAAWLDRLAERPAGRRRALSVACGHLREGLLSDAVATGALDELVALDIDRDSLAVIERTFDAATVRPVELSVRELLRAGTVPGPFDLVYSAGLYDYLEQPFATRLTRALFARTAPGGRLLVCNFVPQLYDIAYMEVFMGWHLVYRTETELAALAAEIPADELESTAVWTDSHDAVAYLELVRRDA